MFKNLFATQLKTTVMDYNQPLDHDFQEELHLSGPSRANLNETAGWAKFLAIVSFVFIGLLVIFAFGLGAFMSFMPMSEELPIPVSVLSFFYLMMAIVMFLPYLYLFRFATQMKAALKGSDQQALENAFANIKAHYKFVGILMAVVIGINALSLVLIVIGGLAGMALG